MISLVLVILAAIPKAFMDLSAHGKLSGDFWNMSTGAKYKWKNGDRSQGEAFWGSSRWFVFLTDGWHLLQLAVHMLLMAAIVTYKPMISPLIDMPILWLAYTSVFQLFYGRFEK